MVSQDDEFVVPHMDLSCLQNSIAYQKVLEEPWTYLHNWDSLTPSVQQEVAQNFLSELSSLKTEMAVTQSVFDPSMFVNQDAPCDTAVSGQNGNTTENHANTNVICIQWNEFKYGSVFWISINKTSNKLGPMSLVSIRRSKQSPSLILKSL
ncbi:unnamed protein product [Schistosoma mattheei]|uniref:Uncharacterized protein n=1 Tax=Schistosoma mattheei TaxID=31246 RepID=A0AA85BA88_9TREM|nr:unnamed protein product [Schistosoma mattheei]